MYFVALATDYDGTLARQGNVDAATKEALREVRRSGRKLILVTGRDLPDLKRVFAEVYRRPAAEIRPLAPAGTLDRNNAMRASL
jgi:HAD superfamily hydrolase (TIGR01484 family)